MLSFKTLMTTKFGLSLALITLMLTLGCSSTSTRWTEVQNIKKDLLNKCAVNAMAQQKKVSAQSVAISFNEQITARGNLQLNRQDSEQISMTTNAAPKSYNQPATEAVIITLPAAIDMLAKHTGLAMTITTTGETSQEVRIGATLIASDGKAFATILPVVPVASAWGDKMHEVYLDWAFINYRDVNDAIAVLKDVKTIELTFGSAKRAPTRGSSSQMKPASLVIADLQLVDYSKGSYNPSRHNWTDQNKPDLTLQHRTQEVTGIVATFGGAMGIQSAVDSLDHCVVTQCWDGSFLDGRRGARTVASGEYTFGFTIYGTLCGYLHLEKINHPALDETLTVGPASMTRREFYQRMFFRAAMARTAALPREYRDDIIGSDKLISGANRVLGYAIAMRMVADAMDDSQLRDQIMSFYQPTIQQIADQQGAYSGGFPLLGEGDRYDGKGIHYDSGYIRTHMDWLVIGVRRTGDPLLVQMLERYQSVFEATMNKEGRGIKPLISERHQRNSDSQLILPDATAQVGMQYNLPVIAQWGYNVGMPVWNNFDNSSGNHFTFASHTTGYSLGAHTSILLDDMVASPEPKDLGYLFPRQFPVWSSRFYNKDGQHLRTSTVTIYPDGRIENDFKIEVGEYLETVGAPVWIKADKPIIVEVISLQGWPTLLEDDAKIRFLGDILGDRRVNKSLQVMIGNRATIKAVGPMIQLPAEVGGEKVLFKMELLITPLEKNTLVELAVLNGTFPYKHTFINAGIEKPEEH